MKYTQKHKNLIAKIFKKAGMLNEAKTVLSCDKYKPEIGLAIRNAMTKLKIGATPALTDAVRRYETRDCVIFSECPLPRCEGGVWCNIYNLGGSHGSIGDAYRYLGKNLYDIPIKKRREIMFEILKLKMGKNYDPDKKLHGLKREIRDTR